MAKPSPADVAACREAGAGMRNGGALYQASLPDANGILFGYWPVLLGQCDATFALSMGLPFDWRIIDGTAAPIPDLETSLAWILDNGSFVFDALDTGGTYETIYIGPQAFNPRAPLANPAALMGRPSNRLQENLSKVGQGLLLATKAAGAAIGTGATIVSALAVVSSMGGAIGSAAAGLLSTIGSAVGLVSATTAAVTGTAGAAIATGAAVVAGSVAAIPPTVGALSTLAATGVGTLPAVAAAVVFAILMGATAAFPAESPSLHITSISRATQIRICYREAGRLRGVVFVNPKYYLHPESNILAVPEAPIDLDPSTWAPGNQADIANVDADTFFAGLVYMRPSSSHGWFGGMAKIGVQEIPAPSLDLLWTQRVSDAGIAAFRQARAGGSSISEAIAAAAATPPILTPFQTQMAPAITPAALAAIPGNAQALAMLVEAHRRNESAAAAYLASPAFLASAKAPIRNQIGAAAGLARPHLTPPAQVMAKAIGLFDAHVHAVQAVSQAAKGIALTTPKATAKTIAAAKSAGLTTPAPTRAVRSLTTGPAPHPLAVLGSGALFGVAGFFLAPREYRLPAAAGAAVAGLLLTRFVH